MAKFKLRKNLRNQFYWVLKAANGETIAVSEMYTRKASAEHTIRRVKELAPAASIEDETRSW